MKVGMLVLGNKQVSVYYICVIIFFFCLPNVTMFQVSD